MERIGGKHLWITKEKGGNHNGCANILAVQREIVWEFFFSILGKAQTEYSWQSTPEFGFDSYGIIVWASFYCLINCSPNCEVFMNLRECVESI